MSATRLKAGSMFPEVMQGVVSPWPPSFERVPEAEWTHQPVHAMALDYDRLGSHGWYDNLDPLVDDLAEFILDGYVVLDYSGGTGLLIDRLLPRMGDRSFGIINVDASAKFLRLCLEKYRDEERVAVRLVRYLAEQRRLETADEVVGLELLRGVAGIACANAIHLYYDLPDTLAAWRRVLRPGGRVFVQSGNLGRPERDPSHWIIDDTVHALAREARAIVREEARFAHYREALEDPVRREAYDALRNKYFLPVRPLSEYVAAFEEANLAVVEVRNKVIDVDVCEWVEFLGVYHEGILGWIGGCVRVEGTPPSEEAVKDRLEILSLAAERLFQGGSTFQADWTYLTCQK